MQFVLRFVSTFVLCAFVALVLPAACLPFFGIMLITIGARLFVDAAFDAIAARRVQAALEVEAAPGPEAVEDLEDLERELYEAYVADAGGLTWDGKPCPAWENLPEAVRTHWGAAAAAARRLLEQAPTDDGAEEDEPTRDIALELLEAARDLATDNYRCSTVDERLRAICVAKDMISLLESMGDR